MKALITGTFTLVNEAMKMKPVAEYQRALPKPVERSNLYSSHQLDSVAGYVDGGVHFPEVRKYGRRLRSRHHVRHVDDHHIAGVLLHHRQEVEVALHLLAIVSSRSRGVSLLSPQLRVLAWRLVCLRGGVLLFIIMFVLHIVRDRHTEFVDLKHYVPLIQDPQADTSIPKEATNLVYMCVADSNRLHRFEYYLLHFPKATEACRCVLVLHVDTVDSPYTSKYSVSTIIPKKCLFIRLNLASRPIIVNLSSIRFCMKWLKMLNWLS